MAGSLNKVFLIGRLGNDPDIKSTQNGKSVAILSLATSESWKDKNTGEKKEKTEWHRVVIFNEGLVNVVQKYLKKVLKYMSKVKSAPQNIQIITVKKNLVLRLYYKDTIRH